MGFIQGFNAGSKLINDVSAENRNQRQQKLTFQSQGYDETGNMIPGGVADIQQQDQVLKLQQQLQASEAKSTAMSSMTNANNMKDIIKNMELGNLEDANKILKNNPILSEKMANSRINISGFRPLDAEFDKPMLMKFLKLKRDQKGEAAYEQLVSSPGSFNALRKVAVVAQGKDNQDRIIGSEELKKVTNTSQFMTNSELAESRERLTGITSVINGQSRGQQDLAADTTKVAQTQTSIVGNKANRMEEALKTNDFNIVAEAYMINNPEKFIGKTEAQRRDSLKQLEDAYAGVKDENLPPEQRQMYSDYITKSTEGVGAVREATDIQDVMTGMDIGNVLLSEDTEAISKVSPRDRKQKELELISSDTYKSHKKMKEGFDADILNTEAFSRLNDEFQKSIKDGNYKSGYFDSAKRWLAKITPEELHKYAGMDEKAIQEVIGLEGSLGMEVALYLKNMSGTAASEQEAQRTISYIIGTAGMDEATQSTTISTFNDNLRKRAVDKGKSLVKAGFVGDTYDKYNSIAKQKASAADF